MNKVRTYDLRIQACLRLILSSESTNFSDFFNSIRDILLDFFQLLTHFTIEILVFYW